MGGDRLELPVVVDVPDDRQGIALGIGAVGGLEAALGVEVVQHRAGDSVQHGAEHVVLKPGDALGLGVVLGPVEAEADRHVLGRQPVESQTPGQRVLVGDVAPGEEIGAVAVALERRHRELAAELALDQRPADSGPDFLGRVRAAGDGDPPVELVGGPAADVLDGAADRVLAVERALRSAQHLDALDVEDVEQRALRPGDVDVVEIEADAGVDAPQRIGLADAAHEGGQRRRLVAPGIDREVRHAGLDLRDIGGGDVLQLFTLDHGDRHRHLLDVLLALPGGDRDDVALLQELGLLVLGHLGVPLGRSLLGQRRRHRHDERQREQQR